MKKKSGLVPNKEPGFAGLFYYTEEIVNLLKLVWLWRSLVPYQLNTLFCLYLLWQDFQYLPRVLEALRSNRTLLELLNDERALQPTGKQGYGYTYTGLNRLLIANYIEGSSLTTNTGANNVTISGYDWNGNITGLTRQLKGMGEVENIANLVTKCLNRSFWFLIFFRKKYLCPIVLMRFTRI